MGNSLLDKAALAQFIGNFQRYFPALGKHALVVLAHAHNVHPPRIVVHERECADFADALIAALIVGGNIQFQALDLPAELLRVNRVN